MNAMANEERIESAPSQISGSRGPGEILKYERNRLGQSVERVSQYLHLSADVVRALEDDRHADLPEPTYVRGYIRSYARYLELDVEPLVQSYNELIQPKTQSSSEKEVRAAPLKRKGVGWVTWVTWGGLLLAVALIAVWWSYDFAPPVEILRIAGLGRAADVEQTEPVGVSPPQEIAEQAEPVTPEIAARTEDRVGLKIAPVNQSHDSEPERTPEVVPQLDTDRETEPEIEPSLPVVTAQGVEAGGQVEGSLNEAESQTELAAATPTPPTPPQFELVGRTAAGEDILQLTFKDQSWTEIYDANNERLLFGLMNSGAVKNVQGTAPFRILLGNSPAVTIQFNGKPFDHSRFDRWDKTARFKVDESSAN
jgi:cytoskeleton protein RodZ